MPYKLISSKGNNYEIIQGNAFVDFNPGDALIPLLYDNFKNNLKIIKVSTRYGRQHRKEELLRVVIKDKFSFWLYCFQTESGGRWNCIKNGENEARVQWRSNKDWKPSLEDNKPAFSFSEQMLKGDSIQNSRCYILGVYKRNAEDNDLIISGIYPTQAQDVEVKSQTNKSIQYKYSDIQKAFVSEISFTPKKNDHLVIHFKPALLGWYLIHQDEVHSKTELQISDYIKRQNFKKYSHSEFDRLFSKTNISYNPDLDFINGWQEENNNSLMNEHTFLDYLRSNQLLKALEFFMKKNPKIQISVAKSLVQYEYLKMKNETK